MEERRRTRMRAQHRHEKRWTQLWVTSVMRLNVQFMRVEFNYGQTNFDSHGFDDVLVLSFPNEFVHPSSMPDELTSETFELREYTVLFVDRQRRTVTVDFLLHEAGIATQWARQAAPGQFLWCIPPRMCKSFAEAARTYIFADPSALPAVRRFHEEAGDTPGQTVLVGLTTSLEPPVFTGPREVSVFERPLHATQLIAATDIAQSCSIESAFIWISGEAQWVGRMRRVLVKDFGVGKENIQFTGYWRAD